MSYPTDHEGDAMRRCAICGEDIARHTREPLSLLTMRQIHDSARTPADARRRVREASRRCPLAVHREENGMPVFRVVREDPKPPSEQREAA